MGWIYLGDDDVSGLSAILLGDDYYGFLLAGRRETQGISFVGADRLIPLKVKAWLDLFERKANGEQVDKRSIRKHRNDIFRLYQVLDPVSVGEVPESIKGDLRIFLDHMKMDNLDERKPGLGAKRSMEVLTDLWAIFSQGTSHKGT